MVVWRHSCVGLVLVSSTAMYPVVSQPCAGSSLDDVSPLLQQWEPKSRCPA